VFESQNALDKLEGFASFFGPDFYGLPRNTETIKLIKTPWTMDQNFQFEDSSVIPIRAGETINWQLSKDS
jgi:dihydroorotase